MFQRKLEGGRLQPPMVGWVPIKHPSVAWVLEGGCQAFNQYPKYECQHTLHQWRGMRMFSRGITFARFVVLTIDLNSILLGQIM